MKIEDIVEHFGMERHPIAGWYVIHYSDDERRQRPRLSSIYYLLSGDEPMPSHKLDGIEVWHFHIGAPAEIEVSNGGQLRETSLLGCDLAGGQRPQLAVPAYSWLSLRSLGDWTLLGCTMSPGYSPRAALVLSADD